MSESRKWKFGWFLLVWFLLVIGVLGMNAVFSLGFGYLLDHPDVAPYLGFGLLIALLVVPAWILSGADYE